MTLYERLENDIEHGLMPITINTNKKFIIWSSMMKGGVIRRSKKETRIKKCIDSLGWVAYNRYDVNALEKKGVRFHSYYHRPTKQYKKGDMVDILEIANTCGSYDDLLDDKKEMIGQKGLEIKDVFDLYYGLHYLIYNKDKRFFFTFRHDYLAPHYTEEECCCCSVHKK